MIEITNSLYNSKERQKQNRLNKYMRIKGKLRLKLKRFFPLNENEKILYEHKCFKEKIAEPEKERYLEFNKRIHMLAWISKSELEMFYFNYLNLVKNNPSKNLFSRAVLDDRTRDSILRFKNHNRGWSMLNTITPKSSNLQNIVDYITIYMFDLSDDYVGISFIITLNKDFNMQLNKELIENVESNIDYIKLYVGNKKRISYNEPSKEIIRKDKIEAILLEVKMRVYDFLKQYIKLHLLDNYAPICLEEYITNYKTEDNDYFLRSYDFYSFSFNRKYEDFPIIINEKEKQSFEKVHMYFECGYEKNINRSARVLIDYTKKEKDNFFEYPNFIPIYINIMSFYINIEFEEMLAKKRDILNSVLKHNNKDIYNKYIEINKEVNYYEGILNSISLKYYNHEYINKDIKGVFKYQRSRYKYLYNKNKKLDEEFNNYISAKSSKDSVNLAKISIWIAVISLLVTMFFSILSYMQSKEDKSIPIIILTVNDNTIET